MDYIVVTNNPLVQKSIDLSVEYCSTLDEVMFMTRDFIHLGYELITHPLSGSVKPVQCPYKSIVLKKDQNNIKRKMLDYQAVKIIESAIKKVEQFKKNHIFREYPKSVLIDYQTIDFTLLKSGLDSI
ncbi:GrdX family protein [Natroniella acetigena]|uniref:GrdX family protein n=1 Tax=Natroniella acetigena TaxID=52004 RepID=UPI00200B4563|nr:GrdX family protein [Natroniella acetigena]MCK8828352.1 GrdX family protein [Natroniella acetigena]